MNQEEIHDKLKMFFDKEESVVFAYLFGSMARGKTDFESDVDLAVYLEDKKVDNFFKERLFLIEEIQALLKKTTEVVMLNETKSIFFKFVIIKEGRVVFERDHSKRVDFELKIMQEYYDFQPFLEEYNKAYLERSLSK